MQVYVKNTKIVVFNTIPRTVTKEVEQIIRSYDFKIQEIIFRQYEYMSKDDDAEAWN